MLRLNMAVPPTPRNHPQYSSLGLIQAAVLGLTDPEYNASSDLQFIPNMDGFPNGRRIEDDVTRIELQAVSGVALAAIGLWYDDYTAGGPNPVTGDLLNVLAYSTGVEENDKEFINGFPFVGLPFAGDSECSGAVATPVANRPAASALGLSTPSVGQQVAMGNYPNPFENQTTIRYQVDQPGPVSLAVYDMSGRRLEVLANSFREAGEYQVEWNASNYPAGIYFARADGADGKLLQVLKLVKFK